MKHARFTFLFLMLLIFSVFSQNKTSKYKKINTGNWLELSCVPVNEKGQEMIFSCVEQMPAFPGGYDSLANFYRKNLVYPRTAIKDNLEGKVIISFMVNNKGKVNSVKVIKGVRYDLDSECIRTVLRLPNWIPGKFTEESISIRFIQPITFKLID